MQQLPDVLYLAIATNPDQTIDGEVLEAYRERLGLLEPDFKALHPNTRFQFASIHGTGSRPPCSTAPLPAWDRICCW